MLVSIWIVAQLRVEANTHGVSGEYISHHDPMRVVRSAALRVIAEGSRIEGT